MESDIHDSKPECYIIDRKEEVSNSDKMISSECSGSQKLINSPLVYLSGSSNNNNSNNSQDKKCGYCSATFAKQEELISHLKIHTFICIECDQTFFDDKALASHMTKHTCKRKWVCEFCNKVFQFYSLLEQHSRSHLGLKPFKCDKCGKHFSRLFNLKVHKRQHLTNGSFDCPQCSKKFSHSSNLSKHLRQAHATQMTHKCRLCLKVFPDLWSLDQHINSHNSSKETPTGSSHTCTFCQQTYTTVDELNQHLKTHADKIHAPPKTYTNLGSNTVRLQPRNKDKQFQCEICSKPFFKLANLSRHLKSHSEADGKEYFCQLCSNQKFTSAKLLFEHQKSSHYGKLPFVCEYCHKQFMFRSLLMQHLRKHTGEKPFRCPHCKKSFVRLFNMKTHLKRHETENRVSEDDACALASIANFEAQKETEYNNFSWDGSVSLESGSIFTKSGPEIDNVHSIAAALGVYQNTDKEKVGKNEAVIYENLSLDQRSIPHDVYFSDAVNQPASQYQGEIPPISSLTSPKDMYTNGRTDEKENENQANFQNLPFQCDGIFFSGIDNQLVSNSQHGASLTHEKEPAVISVEITDEKTEKHNEDLNVTFENLPSEHNGTHGSNLLDNQPVPINQHQNLPTPLKELSIIPITTSSNSDIYVDKSNKDSYVINLETDLSSQMNDTREDLSICPPYVSNNYMIPEQISTDAVAANNSRILQYLNSQTQELNLIQEVDKSNCLLEETTAVSVSEFSESDLIDLTDEINDTKTNLNFACSYCGVIFFSSESLNEHMKLHTVTKPFVCGYCQKSFRYSSLLTQHIKIHRQQIGSFRCNQCSKNFSSRNSLVLHQQTHKKLLEKSKKSLLKSRKRSQQFHNMQDHRYQKCESRVNVFANSSDKYDNAGDTEHGKHSVHLQNKTRQRINQLHTCEYCGKVFKYLSLLTQHVRRHTGEKPFTCPSCRKSFARLFNLEVHQKQHMKKAQPSSLPSTIHSLNQVKKVASNPVSDRMQTICPSSEEELTPTIQEKMTKRKMSYSCSFCDQSFAMHNDLVKHRQKHKPFVCEFCKKEFRFYSLLVQHLPTHTGEKAYYCQICKKSFARLFNLKIHQQKYCGKNQTKATTGSNQR